MYCCEFKKASNSPCGPRVTHILVSNELPWQTPIAGFVVLHFLLRCCSLFSSHSDQADQFSQPKRAVTNEYCKGIIKKYRPSLHSQGTTSHGCVSLSTPLQLSVKQVLVLVWTPQPQDTLQGDHSDQHAHSPEHGRLEHCLISIVEPWQPLPSQYLVRFWWPVPHSTEHSFHGDQGLHFGFATVSDW